MNQRVLQIKPAAQASRFDPASHGASSGAGGVIGKTARGVPQRQLAERLNTSPRLTQMRAVGEMINTGPRASHPRALGAMMNAANRSVAQPRTTDAEPGAARATRAWRMPCPMS